MMMDLRAWQQKTGQRPAATRFSSRGTGRRRLRLELLEDRRLLAVTAPQLVAELNPDADLSLYETPVVVGGKQYFPAAGHFSEHALWEFDPASGQARMVPEQSPYEASYPEFVTAWDERIYFLGYRSDVDYELFEYDPATDAVRLISDTVADGGLYIESEMVPLGDRLYFSAWTSDFGEELWAFDRTTDQVQLVADIASGVTDSSPAGLTVANGLLYFSADDGTLGSELWVYDPTTETATVQADIVAGSEGAFPYGMTEYGGSLFFAAETVAEGTELWRYDLTTGGLAMVDDLNPGVAGSYPGALLVHSGELYFAADNGTTGDELWKLSAVDALPTLVADIYPGPDSSWPSELTAVGDGFVFGASDGVAGDELWRYLPASDTLERVADLWTGEEGSYPWSFRVQDGKLYFETDSEVDFYDSWVYDPAADSVLQIEMGRSADAYPSLPVAVGDRLYFTAYDRYFHNEIYSLPADGSGTPRLEPSLDAPYSIGSNDPAAVIGETLYFPAAGTTVGNFGQDDFEPWAYDTTSGQWQQLANLHATAASFPWGMTAVGGRLFFTAVTEAYGRELMVYDPATGATEMVADLYPGTSSSHPDGLTVIDGKLYFSAASPAAGFEPRVYDPATDTLQLLADIRPGSAGSIADGPYFTPYDGAIYFVAASAYRDTELWRYDPLTGTLAAVTDHSDGSVDARLRWLSPLAGRLYYSTSTGSWPWQLSSYEPATGTQRLESSSANVGSAYQMTVWDDLLLLNGSGEGHGEEPYLFDPATGELTLLGDINPSGSSEPEWYLPLGDTLLISALAAEHGYELYRSAVVSAPLIDRLPDPLMVSEMSEVGFAHAATLSDVDSPDMTGGSLRVEIAAGASAEDRLIVQHEGFATGQIGVSGSELYIDSVLAGTISGGTPLAPLNVDFSGDVPIADVQRVLRKLTYQNTSNAPSTERRTIAIAVTDPSGVTSAQELVFIDVRAVPDRPSIAALGGGVHYIEGSSPVPLADPAATVSDPDEHPDFGGGKLTVRMVRNADSFDRLSLASTGDGPGEVRLDGSSVLVGGGVVGTLAQNGAGTTPLQIVFNGSASEASLTAVVQAIRYESIHANLRVTSKDVQFDLTDPEGIAAYPTYKLVTLETTNDAAVLAGIDGTSVTYNENALPRTVASGATLSDPDYNGGGNLTVALAAGGESADRLRVLHQGMGTNQVGVESNRVYFSGEQVGTISGGVGTNPLVVTLNSRATARAAQSIARVVQYWNTSEQPSETPRTLAYTFNDGGGATTPAETATVVVNSINDASVVGNLGADLSTTSGGAAIQVSTSVTISDVDSPDFAGGLFRVRIASGATADDLLSIRHIGTGPDQIAVSGDQVFWSGTLIGTFTGGSGSSVLQVSLNGDATPLAVQRLARNILFSTGGAAGDREVEFQVWDGDGANTNWSGKTIVVSPSATALAASLAASSTVDEEERSLEAYAESVDTALAGW